MSVKGVLGINDGRDAASLLDVGDRVQRKRRLAGALRAVDLHDAPTRQTANAEGDVEGNGSGRDDLDGCAALLTQAHDRALAELALDLGEGGIKCLLAVADGNRSGVGDVLLGGHGLSFMYRRGAGA